jgi:uncharacterized protein (UPF0147 family)
MPPNTVYVGRPTAMGNPVRAGLWRGYTAEDAVRDFRRWVTGDLSIQNIFGTPPTMEEIKALRGHNLACWCRLDQPCHADVLLEIANDCIVENTQGRIVDEFRTALKALLNEAVRSGLDIDVLLEIANDELHPEFTEDMINQ